MSLLLVAVLVVCSEPAGVASAQTQVMVLDPSQLTPTGTTTGTCGGGSLVSGRANAWRCNIATSLPNGANLLDPCFSAAVDAPNVICPTNYPDNLDAINVTLEAPLGCIPSLRCVPGAGNRANQPGVVDQPSVAFIELSDGVICGLDTGATFVIGFERANYGCSDQTWLAGHPFALADGTWEVVQATIGDGAPGREPIVATNLTLVPVVKAWEE